MNVAVVDMFQFQTGSIKSGDVFVLLQVDRGFNSKLVRLKVLLRWLSKSSNDRFQFQTGSIKRFSANFLPMFFLKFQFQTGSIKRECF